MHITKGFFKVPTSIIEAQCFPPLSSSARLLYFTLCYCLNRFTDGKEPEKDYFFCTSEELQKLTGLSRNTLFKARKELMDFQFIEYWRSSTETKAGKGLTTWHKGHYRILR